MNELCYICTKIPTLELKEEFIETVYLCHRCCVKFLLQLVEWKDIEFNTQLDFFKNTFLKKQ